MQPTRTNEIVSDHIMSAFNVTDKGSESDTYIPKPRVFDISNKSWTMTMFIVSYNNSTSQLINNTWT